VIHGRVLSVNLNGGGVPKQAVERAWVGELGLDGDKHRADTVHGGPLRAICLFGIEVIERLQAEGHPTDIGGVGENLTTSGIEWSRLPAGTRFKVGSDVLLELTAPAMPCDTQRPNFIRGEFKRISPVLFPDDSRMYARVLTQGEVRPGDVIEVLPLAPDNDPDAWDRLWRIDEAELKADVRLWAAAADSGLDIHVAVDQELGMAAAPDAPETAFNHAVGLRSVPNLLPRVLDFYREHATSGSFGIDRAPWAGAVPEYQLAVLAAEVPDLAPAVLDDRSAPAGITIRRVGPDDFTAFAGVVATVFSDLGFDRRRVAALMPELLAARGVHAVLAEFANRPVATGLVSVHRRVGLLRTGTVLHEFRGRGLQRALIRERIRVAIEEGCDLIAAHTGVDNTSERNVTVCGLRRIGTRDMYTFDPAKDPAPETTERAAVR
jgi:MOSC domain-containing protein YiiM/GNAT superfamily N-acetyltransferase